MTLAFFFTALVSLSEPVGLLPLQPMNTAPAAIQKAGESIVRVLTRDGGVGTGFFLSDGPRFVTNSHVVGLENCSREGCFFEIDRNFEAGSQFKRTEVYGVPVLNISELDIAVYTLYLPEKANPKAKAFPAPPGLAFSSTPEDVQIGKELYIVGHGYGGLKRWSAAPLFKTTGDWCHSTHCTPEGNSGSPVLNAQGEITGIVHRTAFLSDGIVDNEHVAHNSIFSRSQLFQKMLNLDAKSAAKTLEGYVSIPGKDKFVFDEEDADSFDIDTTTLEVLIARNVWSIEIKSEGESEELSVTDFLALACKLELLADEASTDPDYEFSACQRAREVFHCQKDDPQHSAQNCPSLDDQRKWTKVFEQIAELDELKNQETFIEWRLATAMDFAETKAEARKEGRKLLLELLKKHPQTEFNTAYYLSLVAQTKDDMKLDSVDYLEWIKNYASKPYARQYHLEVVAVIEELLETEGLLTEAEASALVEPMLLDKLVPVQLKADLERAAYERLSSSTKKP